MQAELTLAEKEAVHNLINLRLYPSPHLRLGQVDRLSFGGATVRLERTGAPFHLNYRSANYIYLIEGGGFSLVLNANYPDERSATACVEALSVTPAADAADDAFILWLKKLLGHQRVPSDPFFDELLLL